MKNLFKELQANISGDVLTDKISLGMYSTDASIYQKKTIASRNNLGIWVSYDEGASFINPVQLVAGFSAYSAMHKLNDGSIGILYEKQGSTQITFLRFQLSDIE